MRKDSEHFPPPIPLPAEPKGDLLPQEPVLYGEPTEQRALLVLGMHRSGTSALTRMLNLLGLRLSDRLLPAVPEVNEPGFWESTDMVALNDEILASAGSRWDDVSSLPAGWHDSEMVQPCRAKALGLLRRDFTGVPFFVVKDPRICRLVPFWKPVLKELGATPAFVFTVRNPLEVADSLGVRDGFTPAKSHLLWLRYTLDAELATRGCPRSFVAFDALLEDWRGVADRISRELEIRWPGRSEEMEAEIDSFLSQGHQHHRFTLGDLEDREKVPAVEKESFRALLAACEGDTRDLEGTFDRARKELVGADTFLSLVVADPDRVGEAGVRVRRKGVAGRIEELEEKLAGCYQEIERLGGELGATHRKAEGLGATLEARQTEIERLGGELVAAHRKAEELGAQLETRGAEVGRLGGELVAAHRKAEELGATLEARGAEVGRLGGELVAAHRKAEELGAQLEARDAEVGRLGGELVAAHRKAEELGATLEARDAEVGRLGGELVAAHRKAEELGATLEARGAEVGRLGGELVAAHRKAEELGAQLEARDAEVGRLNGKLEGTRQEVETGRAALEATERERARLEGELTASQNDNLHLTKQLHAIHASKMWRLRMAYLALRRRLLAALFRR